MLYWNCCLIRTCSLGITEENSKSFWSIFCLILLTHHIGSVNFSKASQVCHIMVYASNYLSEHWQTIHFFQKNMENIMIIPWSWYEPHGKHGNHTRIMPWIMLRNMAAISSSWHDHDHVSPWSWYDQCKIMAWQPYFSNPGNLWENYLFGRC